MYVSRDMTSSDSYASDGDDVAEVALEEGDVVVGELLLEEDDEEKDPNAGAGDRNAIPELPLSLSSRANLPCFRGFCVESVSASSTPFGRTDDCRSDLREPLKI